jgi:tyrosine-specific transport protein
MIEGNMKEEAIALPREKQHSGSILSGVLLIGGTSIGAGMLALPMVTGVSGFFPALMVNTLCWLFMLATGLLLLEATLWMKDGANILSMTERFLGPVGKFFGGASFVFLYYCLLISYISGGAPLFSRIITYFLPFELPAFAGYLLFGTAFGTIIYFGHRVVDRVNWVLMMSLIFSYLLLLIVGSTEINGEYLMNQNWGVSLAAAPVLFSAYGYHNIVPSVTTYLKRNVNALRIAIVCGTALPFVVYSLWQWMILGTLSPEEIANSAEQGVPVTHALQEITGSGILSLLGGYFGFFALVTSFLGVSLSMVDFFADGFKIRRAGYPRAGLCMLVFIPPAIFAAVNPGIFIEALGIAGGFGEAVLNGMIPILMVWVGRYHMNLKGKYRVFGGRPLLVVLLLFTFLIIGLEAKHLFFS